MLKLEPLLASRFPKWFRGRRARVTRTLIRGVEKWSRLDKIDSFVSSQAEVRNFEFVRAGLDFLQAGYTVSEADLAKIPKTGRLVIVANHPSGAVDAFSLLDAVGRVRKDVRIVANDILLNLHNIEKLILPVRVFGGGAGTADLRAIEAALAREECVIVFPAGEVSRLGPRGIRDSVWRAGFVRFARATAAPVLPVHVKARNSLLFYGTSAIYKPAATALLAREMFARRNQRIELRVGDAMHLAADTDRHAVLRSVRKAVYGLSRLPRQPGSVPSGPEPIVAPAEHDSVVRGIAAMELLGRTLDGKEIRVGQLPVGAAVLHEIGRLREVTFRKVGEGTGKRIDLDVFDSWYEHIVLWDQQAGKIAGAYRVARGAEIIGARGLAGLYTASLFDFEEKAVIHIGQGMELGRSFVVPEYWNSRSLDYLWQGIGAYLRKHPHIRYLFGPVSISAALPQAARDQLVAFYSRYFGTETSYARSRRPFKYFAAPPDFDDAVDLETAYKVLKGNLNALGAEVPMLYRQYTDLCESGGTRFLAFGIDPDFNDAIDGLIEVDLTKLLEKKRARYIDSGKDGVAA
ncbi:lysophospholipid acyltransferase family protein [Lysobacter soyae]|uniref:L-ornithine N(alpha)-acyltransferase n=1 Tax=Lysobacter soyae TaxID=2764185 RepID=A0ABX8WRF8_9GAMM|nr:GNAT family N-acyltransferase [Lysobacter sp. CJ11]QYR53422.1 lysophospholipid acyltransferase family protein [Lysobacter sp. CJ11]